MRRVTAFVVAGVLAVFAPSLATKSASAQPAAGPDKESSVADYFSELERAKLIDVDTGDKRTLQKELDAAEKLLRQGAFLDAAVALYSIVVSPRYKPFQEGVAFQNAEYYLGVALGRSGAYASSLDYLLKTMSRGPSKLYFAPAHRRAVDIALTTRDYQKVLGRLNALKINEPIPPGAAGERSYLDARIAYNAGEFAKSEGSLSRISRKSRLYSSALYLRSVIRVRKKEYKGAAEALCEIAATPDDNKYTFVVDDRYFTLKDLARLGLGRIAHEKREYNDAYYHYFQIPDDSDFLPKALFEAGWSMYQKRELGTSRDLVAEFLKDFPNSPNMPEARLLAGYVELADCKFKKAQTFYDKLVAKLQPIVNEMDRIRKSPNARKRLFERALVRYRAEKADTSKRLKVTTRTKTDQVLALLRLDPKFVQLHKAVNGIRRASGDAPHVIRAWRALGRRVARTKVRAVQGEKSSEQEDAEDIAALLENVRRLRLELGKSKQELRRGKREGTLPADVAAAETKRLNELAKQIDALGRKVAKAAGDADESLSKRSLPVLGPMISKDIARAKALRRAARNVSRKLTAEANKAAKTAIDDLYKTTRRILDKAKLGKIDAVIGQKRKLDIEVADLSAGRYPTELHGRLWQEGLIGDDEEFWPFEGEYWADEYEGWR